MPPRSTPRCWPSTSHRSQSTPPEPRAVSSAGSFPTASNRCLRGSPEGFTGSQSQRFGWLREGSRGRTVCINSDPAEDGEAAARILNDLDKAGWTAPEIAISLGYSTQRVPFRGDAMTRRQAWALRCLDADLAGDRTPPLQLLLPRAA